MREERLSRNAKCTSTGMICELVLILIENFKFARFGSVPKPSRCSLPGGGKWLPEKAARQERD